jgi:DNA-binding transcriptional LysR family regulator
MVMRPHWPRLSRHPDIVVEVLIEPALTDIVAGRFDAGIRLGESLENDGVAVPVSGVLRMAVVGTPQYFASHAKPSTPQELRKHRCINFRLPTAGTLYKWEFERGRRKIDVAVAGPLILLMQRGCSTLRWPGSVWRFLSKSR